MVKQAMMRLQDHGKATNQFWILDQYLSCHLISGSSSSFYLLHSGFYVLTCCFCKTFFCFLTELLMLVSFDKLLYLLGHLPIMHLKEYGLTVEPFVGLRK
jgi:hypothetical protein